jgi:hypothetical protein
MSKPHNLAGKRFGKLVAIEPTSERRGKGIVWRCVCDCGKSAKVVASKLFSGHTRSCGCLILEVSPGDPRYRHGEGGRGNNRSVEYKIFRRARHRCTNPNNPQWELYGGRGIKFLLKDINEFLAAVGRRPSKKHSIDRIDNNGHYEVGNLRWATAKQQANNRRKTETFRLSASKNFEKARKNRWLGHVKPNRLASL